jgi:hypothetical protein
LLPLLRRDDDLFQYVRGATGWRILREYDATDPQHAADRTRQQCSLFGIHLLFPLGPGD